MIFFGHVMKAIGMEKYMMLRGMKKDEEVAGGNSHDVRDESGGTEGSGGGSGLEEKTVNDGR